MTFPKLTFDKPIPVSPLIALDRERCILCYRCTRFSQDVAEDGQLVARNRGNHSMITTFGEDAYTAPFSGNVVELCPVGALTSTQYRFEARPWDIQQVSTICGLCPVGCNTSVTTRDGHAKRVLSRNNPEIDGGWLCDKGRYAAPHLDAVDRIREPLRRQFRTGLEPISWDEALGEAERLLRTAQGRIVTALSGAETIEQSYALGRLLRGGLGAHSAVLPESTSSALDAFRLPLSGVADAELIVIVGDDEIVDRAPIVDLWLKKAGRNGAEIVSYGSTGAVATAPGGAAEALHELTEPASTLGKRLRASDRAVLIWCGPGGGGGARLAEAAYSLGFDQTPGCGAFHLPATPNGRGVATAWAAAADEDESDPEPIGLLVVVGDDAAASPGVRALAERAEAVIAVTMFQGLVGGWADLVLPATSALERDGTLLNLEGRLQRLRRAVVPPVPDELAWISKLAKQFDVDVSPHPSILFKELSPKCFDGAPAGDHMPLPARTPYQAPAPAQVAEAQLTPRPADQHFIGELRLVRYRPLFSGPQVERVVELQFQRPRPEVELSAADAEKRQIANGEMLVVRSNGTSVELRARINRRLVAGVVRMADEHAADLHPTVEIVKA
jgi:NADH-quinone oxidoreductase subunit G